MVAAAHTLLLALYISYLPTPLVLLTAADSRQSVHIAPEAFAVASAEFGEEIEFWQNALPGKLQGQLETVRIQKVQLLLLLIPTTY